MMVKLAKHAGFCFGVKRATQMAFEAAGKGKKTFTLGPIIHSPQVVHKLEEMGVGVVKDLQGVTKGTVIIRSHGVSSSEMEEAYRKKLDVVDATCPFVKKAQDYVKYLSDEGYDVIVVGDADHPEVQGIVSYGSKEKIYVVASGEEVRQLPKMGKIGVLAQTTQSFENLKSVVTACLKRGGEVRVFNTICDATAVRQQEATEIAHNVDCMIVIGGYNSANTRRLAEICMEIQPKTYHIETASEIDCSWFQGVGVVGVTAGASTPKWIIDEVMARIQKVNNSD
jgi:4-hydroxy-3-methylbut-2-enyl diphosphate reductase